MLSEQSEKLSFLFLTTLLYHEIRTWKINISNVVLTKPSFNCPYVSLSLKETQKIKELRSNLAQHLPFFRYSAIRYLINRCEELLSLTAPLRD